MKKNLAIAFKSTSLKETFSGRLFSNYNCWFTGFRTTEKREARLRLGFVLETAGGNRLELASKNLPGPARINKYGVNLSGLEAAFQEAYAEASLGRKILFIDELGPMAFLSPSVEALAAKALVSSAPCLLFFRRGAKKFEGTLLALDNTAVAELDPDPSGLRQTTESWIEEHIRAF